MGPLLKQTRARGPRRFARPTQRTRPREPGPGTRDQIVKPPPQMTCWPEMKFDSGEQNR